MLEVPWVNSGSASIEGTFTTGTLPDLVPVPELTHDNLAASQVGWTLTNFSHSSSPPAVIVMYDEYGVPVWYYVNGDEGDRLGDIDTRLLPNGNILVYSNGGRANQRGSIVGSSVMEIDRQTKEVVWEYTDTPRYNFYSPIISGARRLPNGNTLITEGVFGRMFQVTPEKEVVWEFINPYYFPNHRGEELNEVFRAIHYTEDELPFL